MPFGHIGNHLQRFPVKAAAGGVVGGIKEDRLGLFGDQRLDAVDVDLEILLLAGRQRHQNTAGHLNLILIRGEIGLRNNDFVPLVQHCLHHSPHSLTCTGCDCDLLILDCKAKFLPIKIADGLPQPGHTRVSV